MKRTVLTVALVLIISLLCGCVEMPPPATTAPPEPTAPVETTAPVQTVTPIQTIPPTDALNDFSAYEAMLNFAAEPNWLARAIGCVFEKPEDIDLYFMFYLGVEHPGSWSDISEASRQTLTDQGFIAEMDLQIMPSDKLEAALQETFGIGLEDVTIPESWGYIEAEDAYCSNHSDAYIPGIPIITDVQEDGSTVTIHYTIDGYYNTATDEFLDSANLILTLERQEDGSFRALANVIE